jgi:lipoprotein-releasing system ATP-binding protein
MTPGPGNEPPLAIRCSGVTRELGTTVKNRVLDGIDLSVTAGEFVAVTGASGSGKSTLLYLLGVLDRPTSGEVRLFGEDMGQRDDTARARFRSRDLGFVFQFHFLLPEFSVLENVIIPMLRSGKFDARTARTRALEVIHTLGLGDLTARKPSQLSGGQQQRVSIARAVAHGPRMLLADEPTGNLDSKNGEAVMGIFEKLVAEQGLTLIMVTHEPRFAERASRQLIMRDGRIVEDRDQPKV